MRDTVQTTVNFLVYTCLISLALCVLDIISLDTGAHIWVLVFTAFVVICLLDR